MQEIFGVDVSTYQGTIDWNQVKNDPHVQFAMIRSGFGDSLKNANNDQFLDNQFLRNISETRRLNIPHGIYHYSYPEYNQPEEEADYLHYLIQKAGGIQENELIAIDFEENWGGDYDDFCNRFLNKIKSYFNGYNGGVYTNPAHLQKSNWNQTKANNFWVWVALWDNNSENIPSTNFSVVAMKQYSDQGSEAGINGRVDEDVFYGDVNTFNKYGYHAPQVAPTPQPQSTPVIPVQVDPLVLMHKQLDDMQIELSLTKAQLGSATANNKITNDLNEVLKMNIVTLQSQLSIKTQQYNDCQSIIKNKNNLIDDLKKRVLYFENDFLSLFTILKNNFNLLINKLQWKKRQI